MRQYSSPLTFSRSPLENRRTIVKLIREWKGKVHEVVITGGTYIWAGQHYRSLSQIARAITGTRWSGPRFFGLEAGQGDRRWLS